MSVNLAYVNRSIDAAFDLVMRDSRAWDKFDISVEGFYRSFAAFLIVLPLNFITDLVYAQMVLADRVRNGLPAELSYGVPDALFTVVVLAAQWALFPTIMIVVLRFLGLTQRYAPLIIAYNWGWVVVTLLDMPAILLYAANVLTIQDAITLKTIVVTFSLYYRFYTAQTALNAGWSIAASTALLDFVLQLFLWQGVRASASLWLPATSL